MIIAVDGPAASGKGTIARRLAAHYNLAHLDTGMLYRAVGMGMVLRGEDISDAALAADVARNFSQLVVSEDNLRSEAAGKAASVVAAYGDVRVALTEYQRNFAVNPPDNKVGAVIDGRDIGTVICPDANAKLFVTASLEARVDRRFLEIKRRGKDVIRVDVEADLAARDDRDANRAVSPLVQADDADLLDTTNLDIEAAVAKAIALVDACLGQP
jgi:CMP/dCMP kinase